VRALWVDAGNDPDWQKCTKYGMTALFLPLNDPIPDLRRRLSDIRVRGYAAGLYMAWNWPMFKGLSPAEVAILVDDFVLTVSPHAPIKVQFDIELHDPAYVRGVLETWRRLRPKVDTSWTLESFQGGWMPVAFVNAIIATRVRIVPQFYGGDMTPFAGDMALRDLLRRGFPENSVSGFYDAAALPVRWDGFAFSQGRLP
jgi:hypothetical protein